MPTHLRTLAQSILDTHHALLKRELPRLGAAFRTAPPALRVPFASLRALLDEHLWKEEQILFPMIFALADGETPDGCGVEGPITQMRFEHDRIRELEAELRVAASLAEGEAYALRAMLDDLAEHARKEDEELFAEAMAVGAEPPETMSPVVSAPSLG